STITPFFRDWSRFVSISTMLLIYMAPIVYLESMVPDLLKPLVYLNPFTYVAFCYHDVLFYGEITRPYAWIVFSVMAVLAFIAGASLFRRLQPLLGNVL